MEKITVTNPSIPPTLPYRHLEHSSENTADPDDLDSVSVASDLVLADMSDSDTRSVDFLLDDFGFDSMPRSIPKVSI